MKQFISLKKKLIDFNLFNLFLREEKCINNIHKKRNVEIVRFQPKPFSIPSLGTAGCDTGTTSQPLLWRACSSSRHESQFWSHHWSWRRAVDRDTSLPAVPEGAGGTSCVSTSPAAARPACRSAAR